MTLPHLFTAGFFPCLHNFCIRFTAPDSVINEEKIVEFISGKTQLLAASQGRMEHGRPHLQSRAWVAEPTAACVLCGASLGYVYLLRSLEGVEAGSPRQKGLWIKTDRRAGLVATRQNTVWNRRVPTSIHPLSYLLTHAQFLLRSEQNIGLSANGQWGPYLYVKLIRWWIVCLIIWEVFPNINLNPFFSHHCVFGSEHTIYPVSTAEVTLRIIGAT